MIFMMRPIAALQRRSRGKMSHKVQRKKEQNCEQFVFCSIGFQLSKPPKPSGGLFGYPQSHSCYFIAEKTASGNPFEIGNVQRVSKVPSHKLRRSHQIIPKTNSLIPYPHIYRASSCLSIKPYPWPHILRSLSVVR